MSLDKQAIEILGRNRLVNELVLAGLEVAFPIRDRGIDLLVYSDRPLFGDQFAAVPIQMKAASERGFSIDKKYKKTSQLLIVFVWNVNGGASETFALTYQELFDLAQNLGYTNSPGWQEKGRFVTARPSVALVNGIRKFQMTPAKWRSIVAPALVLVPGLMCDGSVWKPVIPFLEGHVVCQIADHGNANSLTVMAQRILDQGPARFALAGHSMGGRVALEVTRLAPERVSRLVLLDTGYTALPAGSAGEEEAATRYALLDIARKQGVRAMATQWVQGMVDPVRLEDAALIESIVAMFERKCPDVFAQQISALLARPDATPVLRSVRVPTLVLCGRADSWSPLVQHEQIAALVPGSELHVVEDAGHMCTMEQPEAVAKALLTWLQQGAI